MSGILVAAPKSGSGKTLIVAGLLRHLCDRGIRAAAAKCGPDYIDPTFHTLACARPCLNLDSWAMRQATLYGLVHDLESDTDLVLCEGVMGLFDGTGPYGNTGSTAELARLTGWPVVLVIDTRGQGASIAALAAGFMRHDPAVPLAGVILNRVASARHEALLRAALDQHLPELPVLGALTDDTHLVLPTRHLGLVPADEVGTAEGLITQAATRIGGGAVDLDRLMAVARPAHSGAVGIAPGLPPLGRRIAVARDAAFVFNYEATLADWRRQGAAISYFSPLADQPPDAAADAIFLPGGYPELHAERLANAAHFLGRLRRASTEGTTIYGECGGYMVLGDQLIDADGQAHKMAGLLPLTTSFAERRRHLGYRAVRLLASGPLGPAGTRFRGHEFHYASILAEGDAEPLFAAGDANGSARGDAGLRRRNVFGSFIHLIDTED